MYIGTEKSGSRTAHFYENTGGGVFTDATTAMNVGETNTAYAISWGDYDGDGDIDLFVGNTATGAANKLYRNEGPDGGGGWNAFVDKASDVGITPTRECSAAAFADYNNARHDVLQCVLQFLNSTACFNSNSTRPPGCSCCSSRFFSNRDRTAPWTSSSRTRTGSTSST